MEIFKRNRAIVFDLTPRESFKAREGRTIESRSDIVRSSSIIEILSLSELGRNYSNSDSTKIAISRVFLWQDGKVQIYLSKSALNNAEVKIPRKNIETMQTKDRHIVNHTIPTKGLVIKFNSSLKQ
jgi:hypothetical protein